MSHREGEGLNCKTESLCGNTLRLELSNLTMYIDTVNVKVDFSILGKLCSIPYFGLRFVCAKSKLATIRAGKTSPRSVSHSDPSK